jgi:transcriptional regulator with XRE-family HTH domain
MSNPVDFACRIRGYRTSSNWIVRITAIPGSVSRDISGGEWPWIRLPRMPYQVSPRVLEHLVRRLIAGLGEDLRRLREDAGVSRAALARAAGIDASYLAKVENGTASPSIATTARLGLALGADPSFRLYPTTGSPIRDRHQAPIASSLVEVLHPRWRPYAEVNVQRPARGWIDLGLLDTAQPCFVATEIQSEMRRIEQLLRWARAKADSLPSWDGWTHLGSGIATSQLLVIRETRANRSVAAASAPLLRIAYPANPHAALESLARGLPWSGSAILWAVRDRGNAGSYRIAVRE